MLMPNKFAASVAGDGDRLDESGAGASDAPDAAGRGTSNRRDAVGYVVTEETVRRVQKGDRDALREVYDCLGGRIYAICKRILGDDQLAEDALQNTFVRIWKRARSLRAPEAFVSWSCRIGTNEALHILRSRRVEFELDATEREIPDGPDGPEGAPDAFRANEADRLDLEAAIGSLTDRRRAVLVLHDIEGYRHREIGDLLGISTGTSKAHLFQARAALKQYLER